MATKQKQPQTKTSKKDTPTGISADELMNRLKKAAAEHEEPAKILEAAKIKSPLVIVSTEPLRLKRLIAWIRDIVSSASNSTQTYFGGELTTEKSLAPIAESVKSYSLFSSFQLIVIYNAEEIKAAVYKTLSPLLANPSGAAFTILTTTPLNSKTTWLSELAAVGTLTNLVELKDNQLKDWVQKEVIRAGAKGGIADDAAEVLIASYGKDLSALSQEIGKLALLAAPNQQITKSLLSEISIRSPERTSFELLNQIAAKNPVTTTFLYKELENQGTHPLQLCAFLTKCYISMLAQKSSGGGPVPAELGNPWFLRNLQNSTRQFTLPELEKGLNTLRDLDMKLKSTALSEEITCTLALERLALRS